ncbi:MULTISPECIES: Fur-regulated basic protein FbpA [Geobacillus]|uniref:Fur-regulated basic protein FbpA n=1 Tax=Bacillus caldolyticus TaxID=1394 RepID=A0ABM6QQG1_BACCL|nr:MULTISPECIES: Fur-regulated basic protein FbpA [Geobacillus]AUI37759.1 Fur-regulated basic protein FbpA [[Bacillus] caldolyticus]
MTAFKLYLREAIEQVRVKRIEQLQAAGYRKTVEGRLLDELTLSELNHEYHCLKEQKGK